MNTKFRLPSAVFLLTFSLLAIVQIKMDRPMILAGSFIEGAGWIEILLISLYGAFVALKMQDPEKTPHKLHVLL
jgi:hypothetical protein